MDPSRVAGAVAHGRAIDGEALAHALADGDGPLSSYVDNVNNGLFI